MTQPASLEGFIKPPPMGVVVDSPDLDAGWLFETDKWQATYILAKKPVPEVARQLNEVLRLVASLGGFLGRKCGGENGLKTFWLGVQRVMDFAAGAGFAKDAHPL